MKNKNNNPNIEKRLEQPVYIPITKVVKEGKDLKTFIFDYRLDALPGQFVNVWIPRLDSKPFSISFQDKNRFGLTILAVGSFSKAIHKLKEGDKIGIFGPYGKGFRLKGKKIALVGGGCGSAPLAFLADEASKKGIDVEFITGARSKDFISFRKRYKNSGIGFRVCTDDGSYGKKGFTTDLLKDILKRKKIDCVYSCGPEIMIKKVIELCDKYNVDCQVSLERYMKCGFGVCGQCCVDPTGICICKEGPVLDKNIAKKIIELGRYKRDATGKKIRL